MSNIHAQMASKDELIKQLQDQVTLWRNKYEALKTGSWSNGCCQPGEDGRHGCKRSLVLRARPRCTLERHEKHEASLQPLRSNNTDILIATDLAGRGIDVSLVINYQMAGTIEAYYVHRCIGMLAVFNLCMFYYSWPLERFKVSVTTMDVYSCCEWYYIEHAQDSDSDLDDRGGDPSHISIPGPSASKGELLETLRALQVQMQWLQEENRSIKEENKTLHAEKPK
ncbi:hypothetical protein F4604DRAFT_2037261 [Suillus subluteus]|nr:hypothetical protein F4604DRAFT_2037261 [Suillus subluteus]